VIRIRQPILDKSALFDIGIAGTDRGFRRGGAGSVARPSLVSAWCRANGASPTECRDALAGEPLLFKFTSWLVWVTSRFTVAEQHPVAFAAWFGLLMTALNLFPIAQLDGGHISYAVFGRKAMWITYGGFLVALSLTIVSYSWLFWTATIAVMLFNGRTTTPAGARRRRAHQSRPPLAGARRADHLRLCFTPAPIQPLDLLGH